MDVVPTVDAAFRELQRLRQGQALGRPIAVLQLSDGLRRQLNGSTGIEAEDVVHTVSTLRRAVQDLNPDQVVYALVDLNLLPEHRHPTLTARQESLALSQSCAAKTVRRRADDALRSLALIIVLGERGRSDLRPGSSIADQTTANVGDLPANATRGRPRADVIAPWRSRLSEFWRLAPGGSVDLICSEIPPEERPQYASPADRNYLRYAKFADLDSLLYVRSQILQTQPDVHLRDFAPIEHHGDDADSLIVIGGPPWNAKYREFLPHLPYFFESHPLGEDDPLVVPSMQAAELDLRLGPSWTPTRNLLSDVAVFTRLTLTQGTTVFLIAGCLTLGVLGAAKCFLHREQGAANAAYITELVGNSDMIVVTRASRVGDITEVPDLLARPPLLVMVRGNDGHFTRIMSSGPEGMNGAFRRNEISHGNSDESRPTSDKSSFVHEAS